MNQSPPAEGEHEEDYNDSEGERIRDEEDQLEARTTTDQLKNLFKLVHQYKPQDIDLAPKLRPFIPEYIPAVGDIDAFVKVYLFFRLSDVILTVESDTAARC